MLVRARGPALVRGAVALAIAGALLAPSGAGAQNLAFALFERYLEPLRLQAGIPGLSAAIVLDGRVVWEIGLGHRDVERMLPALPDTPYPIADLTQTLTATLVLECAEQGGLQVDDPIGRYVPNAPSPAATLRDVLLHRAPESVRGVRYDPSRFALLTRPIEECADLPFRNVLAREILDRLAMIDAVPGYDIAEMPRTLLAQFDDQAIERYESNLERMAVPYRVDRRARPTPSALPRAGLDGAHGVIASVRDLAKFDAALDEHVLLSARTLAESWTTPTYNGAVSPFGMGWFVQDYRGEQLVWHFGNLPDAASSLILKVPARRLTLILLANSDGLSAPFSLDAGDVTSSLFARTFLRIFL